MAFNKSHFANLRTVLRGYKADIDSLVNEIKIDEGWTKVYSQEYLKELKATRTQKVKQSMDAKREAAQQKIDTIIKQLHDDVSDWVSADADSGMLTKLQAIKATGVRLSYSDFELLAEKAAGQYLPLKILSDMAAANGIVLKAPTAERYTKQIADVQSSCNSLLKMYCGPNVELIDALPDNIIQNISYGRFEARQCIMADHVLKPGSVLDEAESHWGNTMAHVEKKTFLTDAETEKINKFYEGYESKAADRTKDLLAVNPGLKELIALSQYSEFLPPEE